MGTIAARDCLRVLELTEQVAAAMLVAARQAIALRLRCEGAVTVPPPLTTFNNTLAERIDVIEEDRALDSEPHALVQSIREEAWFVGA